MNGMPTRRWNSWQLEFEIVMRYAHLAPRYIANKHIAMLANYGRLEKSNKNNGVMGWLMGLEPTTTGITIQDSTN
jgi:hypothetical protein